MASSSSSVPRNNKKMHDVFLSFRGEDTRDNFTSHLHSALIRKGIITFIDNDLKRGDNISQSLLDTIEASSISIIIFSEGYASSGWCLDELLKILDCMHDHGQIVMPVFYHVDPSHVRWQSQDFSFGKHFSGLQEHYPDKMERWKNALTEAANLSGFDSNVIRPDSKLIEEIANEVLKRLDDENLFPSENKDLVGVECAIEEIESLLSIGSASVCKLGIWGIGGIGKTTMADAVFNRISRHFEGSYFARNIRETEKTGGINDLQMELLSKLLNDINVRKMNVRFHLNRLARKKVLIVFDDVSHRRQIELLIGRLDDLASGSRVIITTRDKQVLQNCWVNQTHQLKELAHADAQKLFCRCAFRQDHPDASYTELTRKALKYAQGVPLALEVLGSYLCGCSEEEWESGIRKLEIIPHMEIQEVLKISYDSLDDSQKEIFLDIACLLEGESRNEVVSFLHACGFSPEIELRVLQTKSLITVDYCQGIRMHDLLRDMGREIVRKESIDDPGKRSRLWHHKDICEVLKKNLGTEAVKGITLYMSDDSGEIHVSPYAFTKMPKLRFLKLYGDTNKCMVSRLEGVPFAELRYLKWTQCPLKTLNIRAENLVSLKMWRSKVEQLWDDVQNLVNLKEIDLSVSKSLTKLPDFSRAQNLEIMRLRGCLSLTETHSTIQYLNKLEVFDLEECESLMSLPTSIHSKYLKEFEISGCSKLKNFPEISSSHIDCLELTRIGIKELPSSIKCLSKLRSLRISDCSRLESISSSIFKLDSIEISNDSNLKGFPEISSCNTDGSTGIERLSLCKLTLRNCTTLESLPSGLCMLNSLTVLGITDCPKFERLPDEVGNLKALRWLSVEGAAIREIPESLGQLTLLSQLILGNCSSLESLPSSLCMLKSLTFLMIFDCPKFERFPDEVGNLKALGRLSVKGAAIREIPESLGQLTLLSQLGLGNCSSLESLPSSLCMLKSLTFLEIIDCPLPDELGNLKALEQLSVKGAAIREIPESLGQLALLSKLILGNCSSLESLPSSLCMLKSLTFLEIIDCPKFERLPDELGNLKALKQLIVVGAAIREIPESLGQLSSLDRMNLSDNRNLQKIPESVGQLSSLDRMNLSDNRNLQKIPESIRHLSKLTRLEIRNCERLQTLPKLPRNLGFLDASGWTSLAGLSSIAFNFYAHSYECLKLENEQSYFNRERGLVKYMYFPRNEIPEWFKYQNTGSSIKKMPPPPAGYNKFIGFSFCIVVEFPPVREHHHSKIYVNDAAICFGMSDFQFDDVEIDLFLHLGSKAHRYYRLGIISYVESDHAFLGSYLVNEGYGEEIDPGYGDVSFDVRAVKGREGCKVKKCGIHLVYAQDSTEPTEKED